jgi:hypothetical protein
VIMGEDAFLYINVGEEVNASDHEIRSAHTSTREEARTIT